MFGAAARVVTGALRGAGQALDKAGRALEVNPHVDALLPSTRAVRYKKSVPALEGAAFVAPSATVIGKVSIGAGSSVWYGAVIRGDVNSIAIGKGVCVGDRVMIHCSGDLLRPNPTTVGDNVVIGAGAILHGCVLESECVVAEGAQVLDGAKVQRRAMLGAGSVLSSGKVVPTGQMWAGVPAAYLRHLTEEELSRIPLLAAANAKAAADHALECAKSWEQVELDEYEYEQVSERNDYYYQRLTPEELSIREGEVQSHMVPGRILDTQVSGRTKT